MRQYRRWLTIAVAAVLLITLPGVAASAACAQPSGRILYLQFDGVTNDLGGLKSVQPNGQHVQDFDRQLFWASSPAYSPDGQRIAYVDAYSIRSMASDGTDDRWLVDGGYTPSYPSWSPDGLWVTVECGGDIEEVSRDGYASGWTNLTGQYYAVNDFSPTWAPDGRHFASATDPGIEIYSADGLHTRQLSPLPGAFTVDWSPNGKTLAVQALGDLWLVSVPSGKVRRLTNTPNIHETSPVWSPDGNWIAYGKGPGTDNPNQPELTTDPVIWLMNSNGTQRHSTGVHGVPSSWRAAA
jgi:TolB protein